MFDQFIGIDYSGAATPDKRNAAIQVYSSAPFAGRANKPIDRRRVDRVCPPEASNGRGGKHWSRRLVFEWLSHLLAEAGDARAILIGIDHAFSFPQTYFERYDLQDWDAFLVDFVGHWPTDRDGVQVDDFRNKNPRTGQTKEMRLTDNWTGGAKSVFQFDVQGSVAKSTHAGLPFLKQLREQFPELHFWPFDGWEIERGQSVICESFPTLFRRRFPKEKRTVDQQDAFAIASWMQSMDELGFLRQFFHPPISIEHKRIAEREGWILGAW